MKETRKLVWIAILLWILPIVAFWLLFRIAYEPMLFLLIVYAWYPIIACVISYRIASKNYFGVWKWLSPVAFGVLNASVYYLTYGITNALSMSNVAWDDKSNLVISAIASIIGLGIGLLIKSPDKRLERKQVQQ